MKTAGKDIVARYAGRAAVACSSLLGRCTAAPLPPPVLAPVLRLYSRSFGVNLDEIAKPVEEFSTFKEFFTRPLREGARVVDPRRDVAVAPVDGTVLAAGRLASPVAFSIKIKERYYGLDELLGRMAHSDYSFDGTQGFYLLYYLSPGSYHRVHAPVAGTVRRVCWLPGALYPVNGIGRRLAPDFYAKNSRLVFDIESAGGGMRIFLVMVGALLVGRIVMTAGGRRREFGAGAKETLAVFEEPLAVEKGAELGFFDMGSSVLLLCSTGREQACRILADRGPVHMGSAAIESGALTAAER